MSTRCQVKVQDAGGSVTRDAVTLYHHTDGYPEYMIPKFMEAFQFEPDPQYPLSRDFRGRAGKAASLLCAVDPVVFEPESGHELHGDIEYYYVLHVSPSGWTVDVYQPNQKFWDNPVMKNLRKKISGAPLESIYREIATAAARRVRHGVIPSE